jgi:superfamily II DNA or RNA helicase
MAKLEELKKGSKVNGISPQGQVTVVDVQWHGSNVIELVYTDENGKPGRELVFRDKEPGLEVIAPGIPWAFDSDAHLFRLASEAYRIRMAYLFDPWLAVHTSFVQPLPHQITAVYGEMLPRQPLKFLLADDPGSGKTIMTGLYIKELMLRGDLERCLIVTPGNLSEQWQDELNHKFNLPFEILTNDRIEAARTGNIFTEMPLLIARLDKLSRNEDLQAKLEHSDWDLVVVDEAHKMSAHVFGNETKYTKRYRLGELLRPNTRHFLLLTATPHNGKEVDFQLFMALLDADRFEGRYREGSHQIDVSDLMRRMVKEQLLKFDGKPLFPERRAYSVEYKLSDEEAALYHAVTDYVREEFNRAEALNRDGRKGTVGFALTILQRRLASSPEAIFQSLRRRRERLESKLQEAVLLQRGGVARIDIFENLPELDDDQLEDFEDLPEDEYEESSEQILDLATAAQTIVELEAEIHTLKNLERMAERVRRSGKDAKWAQLSALLQDNPEMFDIHGQRRKLVIFTEHRDTLDYLTDRISTLLGKPESVVTIHGGIRREDRRRTQEMFIQDKGVQVLVATDAAGEGINLQRAHLMVNYDLPWNPTRLEQRFGRIHRIGQTEVCHLWNLVAYETREGDVYRRLLKKIEEQRNALGDSIFDILGQLFQQRELRQLLIQAVRYGDRPEVRAKLYEAVDNLADQERCRELLEGQALAKDSMNVTQVMEVREEFERAEAKRLQPHAIGAFFRDAFQQLGGKLHQREKDRYEISRVPGPVRNRGSALGIARVLPRYERVTFHRELTNLPGKPTADFLAPGHPLLDAVVDLTLERYRALLRRGAVLIGKQDASDQVRVLFYLEHSIQDGARTSAGDRRVISKQMQFVEMDQLGNVRNAGPAPFRDYRPAEEDELERIETYLQADWLKDDLEKSAIDYAVRELVPLHFDDVRQSREKRVKKTLAAVKDRLTKEIAYWDHRAQDLQAREAAGKNRMRLTAEMAQRRADNLEARLAQRVADLEAERSLSPLPPVLIGGAIVIPAGLLGEPQAPQEPEAALFGRHRALIEGLAMDAIAAQERALGFAPKDVSAQNLGWDIESSIPGEGRLRFIEVKGRIKGSKTVTVSRNEIEAGLNKKDDFILAIVEIELDDGEADEPKLKNEIISCIKQPFDVEPDFSVTSVNFDIGKLRSKASSVT